jgi:hypothetical protein
MRLKRCALLAVPATRISSDPGAARFALAPGYLLSAPAALGALLRRLATVA